MSKRLDKIKQYYSSMESLGPDIQEDMEWLISRVEELEEDNHDVRTSCKEWYDSYFRLRGEIQRYKQALELVEDELEYAKTTGNDEVRDMYIKNSIRFINEALEES